ncbi:baseplate hub subunit and tail lysozyme [Tenacibaculum phage PTm1]|nr:baseplate hub subunit and tail lysozyme [Tenacibaculum phage PTm1]BBI90697.1 peptidoglycan-binding protein LysM [Tenacibaculum phage PTm1]
MVGYRESSNNYKAENQYGYIGKYQFGKSALRELGIKCSKEEFKNNPRLQEKAFESLLSINKYRLRKYMHYVGKTINGIKVTESGLLASAHLVGVGNVKKWLRSHGRDVKRDGNGTSLEEYMDLFGGFRTYKIIPKRKIKFNR